MRRVRRFACLTLLVGIACLSGPRLALAAPPNVVLIISDDHGWGDYSFMGHPTIRTPRLDQLAKESLVFRRGYVPSSLCRPSLASILTGLYAHQHKITSNDPPLPPKKDGAAAARDPDFLAQRQAMIDYIDKVPTLPRLLAERGYVSFQTGKWWEGDYRRGGFTHGMSRGGRHGDEGLEIGRKTMQPIYDFIDQSVSDAHPFFVWYAPMLPHSPHNPPTRLLDHYRERAPSLEIAKYWACIEWFDETCGQLLDFLDQRHLRENTLVVYVTDNGWNQMPDRDAYAPKSKQSQYDGGLRTPVMIRWPGHVEAGERSDLISSLDLAPTILAAAEAPASPAMVGINLLDARATSGRRALFGECFTHNAVDIHQPAANLKYRWCISGDLKLIVPERANVPDDVVELYDLSQDPYEENNLAQQQPETVARLRALLDNWWSPQVGDAKGE